ncbi:MAG: hypothetical protein JXX28_07270 [Deltaproteobacteria bacterium]|nr:hypothetical protein [Deltaproteobacteria bacterium]
MRTLIPLVALALTSGCVVYEHDVDPYDAPYHQPVNYAPEVLRADAGVYWDDYNRDDIWYFEAEVEDSNGPRDVVEVWADVYDLYEDDLYIESFELYPTDDPWIWYSDWLGGSTWLDPYYHGYVMDIVAYDSVDQAGSLSIRPATY